MIRSQGASVRGGHRDRSRRRGGQCGTQDWRTRICWFFRAAALALVGACAAPPEARPDETVAALPVAEADEVRGLPAGAGARTAREEVAHAEALLRNGAAADARSAFYAVRLKMLDGELLFRTTAGLGDVALKEGAAYQGLARYREAEARAVGREQRERAIVGQARALLLAGEAAEARRLRESVSGLPAPGLSELDHELARFVPVARSVPRAVERPVAPASTRGRAAAPAIVKRAAWRARGVRLSGAPESMGRIDRITIHHTADPKPGWSFDANAARMRSYQAAHQNDNRWADIGYHFVVDEQGRIWEGRELCWQGAHAGCNEANRHNVGIALVGDFDHEEPRPAQVAALGTLVRWLVSTYRVRPSAVYTHAEIKRLYPQLAGTACPGRHLARRVSELQRALSREVAAAEVGAAWDQGGGH